MGFTEHFTIPPDLWNGNHRIQARKRPTPSVAASQAWLWSTNSGRFVVPKGGRAGTEVSAQSDFSGVSSPLAPSFPATETMRPTENVDRLKARAKGVLRRTGRHFLSIASVLRRRAGRFGSGWGRLGGRGLGGLGGGWQALRRGVFRRRALRRVRLPRWTPRSGVDAFGGADSIGRLVDRLQRVARANLQFADLDPRRAATLLQAM